MSLLRASVGALIGGFILTMEGWPVRYITKYLPKQISLTALFLLIGVIAGLISGSIIWGAISGFGVLPATMIIYTIVYIWADISIDFKSVGIENILGLIIGGILGGIIINRLYGSDEYIFVKMRK